MHRKTMKDNNTNILNLPDDVFSIQTDEIPYLSVRMLDEIGVPNLYSTRFVSFDAKSGEGVKGMRVVVMKTEDPAEAAPVVFANRDKLARQLGSSIEHECVTDQMHTSNVYVVKPEDLGPILREDKPGHRRNIDGLITDIPDAVLTAFGGDCPPVFIVDPVNKAICLVHAGWRSTFGKKPAVAIRRMSEEFGSDPVDLYAAIGPGICRDCYEMGDEIYDLFADEWGREKADRILSRYPAGGVDPDKSGSGKYHLDLNEANLMTLLEAGVPGENIAVSDVCTMCNADVFYSYRAHRMENEQAAMIVCRFGGDSGIKR